jgi:hypothetical protein
MTAANDDYPQRQSFDRSLLGAVPISAALWVLWLRALAGPWMQ